MPAADELAEDDDTNIAHVTCPGCSKRMARQYMNHIHECRAGVEQPEYIPTYKLRARARRTEWNRNRKDIKAALCGITTTTPENSYVVDYGVVRNPKHTGREDSVHTVPKSEPD